MCIYAYVGASIFSVVDTEQVYEDRYGLGVLPSSYLDIDYLSNEYTIDVDLQMFYVEEFSARRHYLYNDISTKFESAKSLNNDVVGWVYLPDSNIDYPIMYREGDNTFYLTHDAKGEHFRMGSIFLDASSKGNLGLRSNTQGLALLQGHSSKDGKQFGQLLKFKEQAWFEEHRYIYILEDDNISEYEVFAVTLLDANNEGIPVVFASGLEKLQHMQSVYDRSLVTTEIPQDFSNVMVLSTCSYESDNYRCVVYATKIRR